jgi:hypothetical protein
MVKEWWNQLKQKGSSHYQSKDDVQPIDLYVSGGGFRIFCAYSIIKYAFRQRSKETGGDDKRLRSDITKIKHYADLLLCSELGEEIDKQSGEGYVYPPLQEWIDDKSFLDNRLYKKGVKNGSSEQDRVSGA